MRLLAMRGGMIPEDGRPRRRTPEGVFPGADSRRVIFGDYVLVSVVAKGRQTVPCLSLSVRRSRSRTRPAYLRVPTHQWHRAPAAALQAGCPRLRRAHAGPSGPPPLLGIVAEHARGVAAPCTSFGKLLRLMILELFSANLWPTRSGPMLGHCR